MIAAASVPSLSMTKPVERAPSPPTPSDPGAVPKLTPVVASAADALVEIDLDGFLTWDRDLEPSDDDRDPFARFWGDVLEAPTMRDRLRRLFDRVAL
jgi:hypothetical protein